MHPEIETVINNLSKKQTNKQKKQQKPRAKSLHRGILSTFREEIMPIFSAILLKISEEGTLPNSF